eukprot:4315898-Pyramimonas_sp.AAC.1
MPIVAVPSPTALTMPTMTVPNLAMPTLTVPIELLRSGGLPFPLRHATIYTLFPVEATDRRRVCWNPRRQGVPRGRVASGLCWTVGK